MGTQLTAFWQNILDLLEKEVTKPSFETWLKPLELASFQDGIAIVQAPNEFAKDWVEGRYALLIQNVIQMVTGEETQVQFTVPGEQPVVDAKKTLQQTEENELPLLNPKYTFDTFVVGNSNRFAHAASLAVAEAPAKSYNPLFIYGGVGLGKTHLMQAIGHYVVSQVPHTRILYASSEKFTNELINAIRDGDQTAAFRNKYRNIDILLIDDIQFLAGKERTQEEFFHTFNSLHEANKQIIISSDRPPKEIPTLEDRLRSRFEWGLITDIQPPDLETREAILRKKTLLEKLDIPNEVLIYIAHKIPSNIRELEGALNRVVAFSSMTKMPITVDLAAEALKDILPSNKPKIITIQEIQKTVAEYFNLQVEDFKAKKRTRAVAFPRQIAMYLSREMTDISLPKIGDEFGGRDHTTVIHAHEKIQRDIQEDPAVEHKVKEIILRIQRT